MTAPVNVGDVLAGKYAVERVIGTGGMGVVVAARHLQLGERVAIKFLLPSALAQEDVVQRFKQEGSTAVRIRSEHVARVFDVGTLETGAPYIVMEYLDGTDLGNLLRDEGPLPPGLAVEYVLQACEAIAEAHAQDMVHRDLKPANLFLTSRADGSPVVKVIDFGISKVVRTEADGGDGAMTKSAIMMGSPLFMAPEQMASARDVDARADIWSIGVILHTLIAGTPPFAGTTALGVFEQMMKGAPPLRTLRSDVPEGLERVVLQCLLRDREQRPTTVADLAAALAPFAPDTARLSIDRITRILRTRSEPPPGAGPSRAQAALSAAGPVSMLSAEALGWRADGRVVVSGPSLADSRLISGPTAMDASWGAPDASGRKPRAAKLLGIAAVMLTLGIGGSILALRVLDDAEAPRPPEAEVQPAHRGRAEPTSAAEVTPNRDVVPAEAASAAPPPSTSVHAVATPPPALTTKLGAASARPRATAPAPPTTRKPTSDPFSDPH